MTIDRSRYELEVDEQFEADDLDERLWLRHYLPHWSSREASAARFDVGGGELRLRIDADQPPWNPEHDGWLRVSGLQTGQFAGSLGSGIGQLQFAPGLTVREEQPSRALYTPRYGLFEIRLRGIADPANMVALWMIGYEDAPERSGEILICEVFGREMSDGSARIGVGVRPWADPSLSDGFEFVQVSLDAREPHWYAAEWMPDRVRFYIDEREVKVVEQSPAYPMQFMLSLYEFADGPEPASPRDAYPKVAIVERFRGWRPVTGPGARERTGPAIGRTSSTTGPSGTPPV
ncbi:MAG TPA: glycoside hydrolase family 16 protein [Candidatus Limnocylindrales bacterium]|nr:glycoside hydrolase family 16 protein [Candidatus Limnocylindrales bacterium]